MKRTIKLAVVAALALGATSAFATNGDVMIGQGAKSRAMAGTGIAKGFGAESILTNPATIKSVKNKEFTFVATLFMPDVETSSNAFGQTGKETDSDADLSVIPEIHFASRINDNLVYGFTVAGTAGMGTNFADAPEANVSLMRTKLGLLKVAVPVAYTMNDFTIAIMPVLQYGSLEISHNAQAGAQNNNDTDIGFGYEIGTIYDISSALSIGAVYKSEIKMTYENVLSRSIASFGQTANITSGDDLDQPAEFGVGIAYTSGEHTLALDYRRIEYAGSAGYDDFNWEDQDIISIGYEYATSNWALRAGYNHASSPIEEQKETGNGRGSSVNFFNISGFPGIVESHYTFGGGYNLSDDLTIDAAIVYAAENEESFQTNAFSNPQGTASSVDTKHSQLGISIAATYTF